MRKHKSECLTEKMQMETENTDHPVLACVDSYTSSDVLKSHLREDGSTTHRRTGTTGRNTGH